MKLLLFIVVVVVATSGVSTTGPDACQNAFCTSANSTSTTTALCNTWVVYEICTNATTAHSNCTKDLSTMVTTANKFKKDHCVSPAKLKKCKSDFCNVKEDAAKFCLAFTNYTTCTKDPKPHGDCRKDSSEAKKLHKQICGGSPAKPKNCKSDFCKVKEDAAKDKFCLAFTTYNNCAKGPKPHDDCTKDSSEAKKIHKRVCGGCGAVAVQISLLLACLLGVFTKTQFY